MQNSGTSPLVRREDAGPVRLLTLAHPERRNALSLRMMQELRDRLLECAGEPDVAVVVLAADGPVFSSGHDLRELHAAGAAEAARIFRACTELMEAVQSIPPPVIAAVRGLATAAGCQLVATCDLVVAAEQARFATPGVKIGLFCSTPMVALTRAIGRKRALEMLLTGREVSAREACEWGLVNRVVAQEQVHDAALELASQIAAASPTVVAGGKQAFYRQIEAPQTAAYARMSEAMTAGLQAEDAREGICAFLEKRAPVWKRPHSLRQ
jgi:enoyl-CoA hydratase/carnithine racemase